MKQKTLKKHNIDRTSSLKNTKGEITGYLLYALPHTQVPFHKQQWSRKISKKQYKGLTE